VEETQEILNPLDQALTNVIQNLIKINDGVSGENVPVSRENMTISFEDPCDNPIPETSGDTETDRIITSGTDFCDANSQSSTPIIESRYLSLDVKTLKRTATSIDLPSAVDNGELSESSSTVIKNSLRQRDSDDSEIIKSESISSASVCTPITVANITSTMSVFSIGPLPASTASPSSIKSVQFSNPLIVGPSNRFLAPVFGTAATELENFMDNCIISSSTVSSSREEQSIKGEDQRLTFKLTTTISDNIADSDSISVDSSSSLDTVREFPTADVSSMPSTSATRDELRESAISSQKETTLTRTPEEVLATRADRLKRLEEQTDWLMKKHRSLHKIGGAS